MKLKFVLSYFVAVFILKTDGAKDLPVPPLPVVLWHGMGDSCCFPFSLGSISKLIKSELDNIYVKSLRIGGSYMKDYESGYFIHPNIQVS